MHVHGLYAFMQDLLLLCIFFCNAGALDTCPPLQQAVAHLDAAMPDETRLPVNVFQAVVSVVLKPI